MRFCCFLLLLPSPNNLSLSSFLAPDFSISANNEPSKIPLQSFESTDGLPKEQGDCYEMGNDK